jgi:hypothetical protein
MLELKNIEGKIDLSLEIIGYQFPDSKSDDWCLLKATIIQGSDECELIDPAIETSELVHLLRWFSSLAEGRLPRYAHLTFTEPCIGFKFLSFKDGVVRIAINLGHELKPPFEIDQFRAKNNEWSIVAELKSNELTAIRNGIKHSLEVYPVRGS